ncbi:MAG: ATP-binding protein [Pyrinomonadaceae bacterium]
MTFLDVSPLPAIIADRERRIVALNNSAKSFLGSGSIEMRGARLVDWVRSAESIVWLNEKLSSSEAQDHIDLCEFVCGDGIYVWGEIHARSISEGQWLLLINDISDRKKAEKSLLASEKQRWKMQRTEALERLAGGIAHDFNNFLAVILLQTDMINLQLTEDHPLLNRVNEIRAVSNDAASIVRQLLAFGRRQSMNPSPTVLNDLLEASFRDLKALLGERVELILDLDTDLGVCFVDSSQIAQALMYLVLNARDAMEDGGHLTIRTTNIDRGGRRVHKTQTSGEYIQIEVTDTGSGIDPRFIDHLFEPFFSTKGSNRSTGLGLATVYGIIKQCGGYIWVNSEPNNGTTFKIQFPRVDQGKARSKAEVPILPSSQMQTVLLVEDEVSVRKVVAEGLRKEGYRVLEASNGRDAIDIARTFPGAIELIIADYSMPVMNGAEAVAKIKEFHMASRVLFISGDPGTFIEGTASVADAMFLDKPFSMATLIKTVGNAMVQ